MDDLTPIATALAAVERTVERRVGEAKRVLQDGKAAAEEVADLESRIAILDEAMGALNSYADQTSTDLQTTIERLVTHGLRVVFNQEMEFSLQTGMRGKYATTDFVIRSKIGDEWVETPVMAARGGGVAAVTGFILRLILLLLRPNASHVLFLDETFAHLSEEYEPRLAEFIRELVDRTDVQIVMVTQSSAYDSAADVSYRLSNEDGRTKVERL